MISNTAPVRVSFFKHSMMRKRIRTSKRWFGLLVVLAMLDPAENRLRRRPRLLGAATHRKRGARTGIRLPRDSSSFLSARAVDGKPPAPPSAVLFGKNGLVWGRGVFGTDEPGTHKQEHDGRAPAGVFRIGTIYTYDSALPEGAKYPFHTVNAADAWVDDITSPDYNQHVAMFRSDPANPPPVVREAENAAWRICLSVARGNLSQLRPAGAQWRQRYLLPHSPRPLPAKPPAAPLSWPKEDLVKLIRFLRADKHPRLRAPPPEIRI